MSQARLFADPAQPCDTRRANIDWKTKTYPAILFLRRNGVRVTRQGSDHVLDLPGGHTIVGTKDLHRIARSMGWRG